MLPRRAGVRALVVLGAIGALALPGSAGYTVRPGDTLSDIAAAHGTTVDALARTNGLANPNHIVAGQTLQLPGDADGVQAEGSQRHTVQPGETLSRIAGRYGTTVRALSEANDLADPNRIRTGTPLRVPVAAAGSDAPAPTERGEVGALLERIAREHGWNPAFVKALAWQESGWNNAAVSSAGAVGIMQVMPGTGRHVSRRHGQSFDLRDPADNIRAGVLFLDELYELTGRDARMTLAGYYQGLRSVRVNGMYPSTERYITNVMALRDRFR